MGIREQLSPKLRHFFFLHESDKTAFEPDKHRIDYKSVCTAANERHHILSQKNSIQFAYFPNQQTLVCSASL